MHAVLTGDIVGSSELSPSDHRKVAATLQEENALTMAVLKTV